jgi:hypothetical protein
MPSFTSVALLGIGFLLYRILKVLLSLRFIAQDSESWRDQQNPFPRARLDEQWAKVRDSWREVDESRHYADRFTGREITGAELAELKKLDREWDTKHKYAKLEVRIFDQMVQANAKVANGTELRSEAHDRVFAFYEGEWRKVLFDDSGPSYSSVSATPTSQ